MNVKTISVTYERKFNTGYYSSATLGVSIWADIEVDEKGYPVESAEDVLKVLWNTAKESVKDQTKPIQGLIQTGGGK